MTRALLLLALLGGCAPGDSPDRLILGATHTLEDTGLLDSLVAAFRAARPEQDLQVVVAGTGEVLQLATRGDVDVLVTHSPEAEESAVRTGWVEDRRPVMRSAFVLLGPPADPLDIRSAEDVRSAFARLRDARAAFVSRGDDSGTHRKELDLWRAVGVFPPDWPGYVEAGSGMADALRVASQRAAYILSERATWRLLQAQLQLDQVFGGDTLLANPYSVLRSVLGANHEGARLFADWITGEGQAVIGRFGARSGDTLFVPAALAPGTARQ